MPITLPVIKSTPELINVTPGRVSLRGLRAGINKPDNRTVFGQRPTVTGPSGFHRDGVI